MKISTPCSLDQRHIDLIRNQGEGNNFSAKLRFLLDKVVVHSDQLVKYNEDFSEEVAVSEGAFLVYRRHGSDRELTDGYSGSVSELKMQLTKTGLIFQEIESKEHRFYALWACTDTRNNHVCPATKKLEEIKKLCV